MLLEQIQFSKDKNKIYEYLRHNHHKLLVIDY